MRKTIFFLLFAAFFTQLSCSLQRDQISVRIDGWGNDTVFAEYMTFAREEGRDTIVARNGRFGYTLPVGDSLVQVQFHRPKDLYPRPGTDFLPSTRAILTLIPHPGERLRITGRARPDAVLEYTARGPELAEDLAALHAETLPCEIRKDSNEFALIEVWGDADKEAERFAHRKELNAEIRAIERKHIRNNPDRLSSAIHVLRQPLDSFPVYYALLTDEVKNGLLKPALDEHVRQVAEYRLYQENRQKEFVGRPAPDFTLTDINGETFTLSAFDNGGKYIVLDFWGRWCGPCIHGMPEMKKQYEKHHGKLEIIGIACRDKEADWKKAVAENGLPWLHVINDEGTPESSVPVRYAVDGYPTKIILAPDKTYLFKFVGEDEDFYKKLDELLNK